MSVQMQPVAMRQTLSVPTAPLISQQNELVEMEDLKTQRTKMKHTDEKKDQV
jgi:hypothetical protein